jgi:hypothetical protein
MLGGGWRQAGPLAAAALVALDEAPAKLARDHANAKRLAAGNNSNTIIGTNGLEVRNKKLLRFYVSFFIPRPFVKRLGVVEWTASVATLKCEYISWRRLLKLKI